MKKSVIFIVLIVLIISLVSAKTSHPISKIEIIPENVETHRTVETGTTNYYYGTGLVVKEKDNELTYFHKDNLGSTRVVTNSNGDIAEINTYLPYGENLDNSQETFTFTGKELDSSGLTYFGARYYDPSSGRFITVDPIGSGNNWYAYANNNPMKFIDPAGLSATTSDMPPPGSGAETIVTPDTRPIVHMSEYEVTAARPSPDSTPLERYNAYINNIDYVPSPAEHDLAMKVFFGHTSYRETGHKIYQVAMAFVGAVELGMGISDAVINARHPAISWYDRISSTDYLDDLVAQQMRSNDKGVVVGSDRTMDKVLNNAGGLNKRYGTRYVIGVHGDSAHPGMLKILDANGNILADNIPTTRLAAWVQNVVPSGSDPVLAVSCYGSVDKYIPLADVLKSPIVAEVSGNQIGIAFSSISQVVVGGPRADGVITMSSIAPRLATILPRN